MARVTFGGVELEYVAPDQQVKLFFPKPGQEEPRVPQPPSDGDVMRWYQAFMAMPEAERPWMRSYSIRAYRKDQAEIDIDFVLHGDSGPASAWAEVATPGDVLGILGPAISHYGKPGRSDWRLFAGDESALPAIGASVEALPPDARAIVYVEIADAAEEQTFDTEADVTVHWVHRNENSLLDAVREAYLPEGDVFAWLAGESSVVRELRRHLVNDRGLPKKAIAFSGYWRADASQDAPPTAEDIADSQEALSSQ